MDNKSPNPRGRPSRKLLELDEPAVAHLFRGRPPFELSLGDVRQRPPGTVFARSSPRFGMDALNPWRATT